MGSYSGQDTMVEMPHRVRELYSRCSPQYFQSTMESLKPKMGLKHIEALKKTPFYIYFDMPKLNTSFIRIEAILRRFDVKKLSFIFGEDVEVPFVASEFSMVLGLQQVGQSVDVKLKMESLTFARLFGGQFKNVNRSNIAKKLEQFVSKESEEALGDFSRLYILLVFNCILFPTSNYWTPRFLLPYLDDLSRIGLYAWGEAAYNFIVDDMRSHCGGETGEDAPKKYLDGCTIGLTAWIYERIPSLASPRSLHEFPRFYRWGESKLPNNLTAAERKLKEITKDMVLPLAPSPEEFELLGPIRKAADAVGRAVPSFDADVVEAVLRAKDEEIKALQHRVAELEDLMKKYGITDPEAKESEKKKGEETEEAAEEPGQNVVEEAGVSVGEEKGKMTGGFGEEDEKMKNDDGLDAKEGKWTAGNEAESGKGKHDDGVGEASLSTPIINEESANAPITAEESVNDPDIDEEAVNAALALASSIVMDVQNRTDRVPKRKVDFVTPPSTSPSKRVKQVVIRGRGRGRFRGRGRGRSTETTSEAVPIAVMDVEDQEKSVVVAKNISAYIGRTDYKGRNEIPDVERSVLDTFISRDDFGITVWEGADQRLVGEALCGLLFGDPIRGDVVDCYLSILQTGQVSAQSTHGVFCMSTLVQTEILMRMKDRRMKAVADDDFLDFMDNFSISIRRMLEKVTPDVLEKCRYLIIPVNDDFHWFLIILDTQSRKFVHMNSLMAPAYKQASKVIAKFYSQYLRVLLGYNVSKEVEVRSARQQKGDLDCGVYVCLWAECWARDKQTYWVYAENCNMDCVRAHIAYNILTHEHGLLH